MKTPIPTKWKTGSVVSCGHNRFETVRYLVVMIRHNLPVLSRDGRKLPPWRRWDRFSLN